MITPISLISLLCLAAFGWVALLRRRVQNQTGIILQRLQREVALEERYRDLFENASDMVYTHDLAGNLTSLNRAGERITGYHRDDVLKLNLAQIVAPEHLDLARQIIHCDRAEGSATTYELEIVTRDGRRVSVEVSARTIHREGKPEGVQCNARDITERKRAEAEMKKAKEAAEAASRAKSEFLANMSHEIRTPMNGIIGMAQLLLDTPVNPEQREYLGMVGASANSLMAIINDILDFSKIEAGKVELENVEFSLRECVAEIVKGLSFQARQKGLKLKCLFEPKVPELLVGDPVRLRQVLVNLIGNAIKFTEQGEVAVRVGAELQTAREALLCFSVQDTGIGIPLEKQGVIFEPFRQADGSTTRSFGGTGLGLTISSKLVEMLGGRVWVESALGKGSTFQFTVRFGIAKPSLKAAEVVRRSYATLPSGSRMPSEPHGSLSGSSPGLRILVAEDNPTNQKVITRILEKRGHRVVIVVNGREALAAIESAGPNGYDLAIMDVQMPEMDGLEATALLRESEKGTGAHLPIIAVTAHAMKGDRELCLAAGMDDYISKPLRAQDLTGALDALFSSKRKPAEHALRSQGNAACAVAPAAS